MQLCVSRQRAHKKCMATTVKNQAARRLYVQLGYHEAGIVDCYFNGMPGIKRVCLEKTPDAQFFFRLQPAASQTGHKITENSENCMQKRNSSVEISPKLC